MDGKESLRCISIKVSYKLGGDGWAIPCDTHSFCLPLHISTSTPNPGTICSAMVGTQVNHMKGTNPTHFTPTLAPVK